MTRRTHDAAQLGDLDTPSRRAANLVVADAGEGYQSLNAGMARLGWRSITVRHPLDAIVGLQDEALEILAVLAPIPDAHFDALEFFAFMKDAFPRVRRIAYTKRSTAAKVASDAAHVGLLDTLLTYCSPLYLLAEALQPARGA
jgi:hypothetical protein